MFPGRRTGRILFSPRRTPFLPLIVTSIFIDMIRAGAQEINGGSTRRFDTEVRHGGSTWVISEWRVRRGEEEAGFGRGGGGGTPFTFPSRGRRGPSGGCGGRPGRVGTHRCGFSPCP